MNLVKTLRKNKIILVVVLAAVFLAGAVSVLIENVGNFGVKQYNPVLTDNPIYVKMTDGTPLMVDITSQDSRKCDGLTFLAVNVDNLGTGEIEFRVQSDDESVQKTSLSEKEIKIGEWNRVGIPFSFAPGETVTVTVTPKGCAPYLMYVPEAGLESMPYSQCAYSDEASDNLTQTQVSLGFYCSELNTEVLLSVIWETFIWFVLFGFMVYFISGRKNAFLEKNYSDLFLLAVFLFVCAGIYSAAYKNGIFISADSAGYMREAVNMRAGNGFAYDGLAGYDSWFANWPILYPFMIFIAMIITGQNAYVASKFLTAVLVLVILLVLRLRFKKDAWIYSLCLLNLGFTQLSYYTWSEIPFILFLMLFAFKLGDIVSGKKPVIVPGASAKKSETVESAKVWDYVLLGVYGFLCFLTRYFGIYVWIVVGGYIALYLLKLIKTKDKGLFANAVKLTVTALVSGMCSVGYLLINKLQNGMPSGVSRTTWWDDRKQLTYDLINSLITEIGNAFRLDFSEFAGPGMYLPKVVFILIVLALIIWFAVRKLSGKGGIYSPEGVCLILGGSYYAVFTVIRYFSSMDTFYFRFFEPASFIVSIALLMIILSTFRQRGLFETAGFRCFRACLVVMVLLGIGGYIFGGLTITPYNYYDVAKAEWDGDYAEIPNKSVVIFSDLDYRSEYYRPDVVSGEIVPEDTWEKITDRYYGSEHLCILREYAKAMADCGDYDGSVEEILNSALADGSSSRYIVVNLKK